MICKVLGTLYKCQQGQQLQGWAYLGSRKEGHEGGTETKLSLYPR